MTRTGSCLFRFLLLQALLLALAAHPLAAGPLVPSGPEIQVGVSSSIFEYYRGGQPRVAVFPDGGFVVVWQGPGGGVRAQLFYRDGAPQGGELQLLRPYRQTLEGVAVVSGGFVVVWDQANSYDIYSVFAAVFDCGGARLVAPFKIHANSPHDRYLGRLAATPDGGFVVAWQGDSGKPISAGPPGANNHSDVFARFFAAGGTPRTPEILVVRGLSYLEGGTLDGPFLDAIAAARDGSVVFAMDAPDGPSIWLRRLSREGARIQEPLGGLDAYDAVVATAPDGGFSVAGTNNDSFGCCLRTIIVAGRFDAGDKAQGNPVQLNFRGRFEIQPVLAYLPDGSLTAIWTDTHDRDGDGDSVYGRSLGADGTPFGPDFRVNSTTAGDQIALDLAATPDGAAIALYTRGISAGGGVPIVARFLRPPS